FARASFGPLTLANLLHYSGGHQLGNRTRLNRGTRSRAIGCRLRRIRLALGSTSRNPGRRRGPYTKGHSSLSRLVCPLCSADDLQAFRGGECRSHFGLSVRLLRRVLANERPKASLGTDGNSWPCRLGSRSALLVTLVGFSMGTSRIRCSRTSRLSDRDRGL